jgi:hypothetical protein
MRVPVPEGGHAVKITITTAGGPYPGTWTIENPGGAYPFFLSAEGGCYRLTAGNGSYAWHASLPELCKHDLSPLDCADCSPRRLPAGQGLAAMADRARYLLQSQDAAERLAGFENGLRASGFTELGDGMWAAPPGTEISGPVADFAALAADAAEGAADELGPWIDAQYGGRCAACGDRWEPGVMIRHDDGEDGWICSYCGSESTGKGK